MPPKYTYEYVRTFINNEDKLISSDYINANSLLLNVKIIMNKHFIIILGEISIQNINVRLNLIVFLKIKLDSVNFVQTGLHLKEKNNQCVVRNVLVGFIRLKSIENMVNRMEKKEEL